MPRRRRTCTIFLSEHPARNWFCLSASGLNLTQYGIRLFVNTEMHLPVDDRAQSQRGIRVGGWVRCEDGRPLDVARPAGAVRPVGRCPTRRALSDPSGVVHSVGRFQIRRSLPLCTFRLTSPDSLAC